MGESDFLFKMPSFLDGAARSIDLFGSFDDYNGSEAPAEADVKAFYHDMQALRKDANEAMVKLKDEAAKKQKQ
jgi:hypothetical protein